MSNRNFLRFIIITSLLAVVALGSFSIFFISPAFKDLIIKNTESEAAKVGHHLSGSFLEMNQITRDLPADFAELAKLAASDFGLMKIKVFALDGETVYSTSAEDIGTINKRDYFHNIVARGSAFTKLVKKDTESLEDQVVTVDVVETYVPIMRDGNFTGAFEIYFDITEILKELNDLLFHVHFLMLLIAAGMMLALLVLSFIAKKSFIKQELADKKIKQQSLDLQEKNTDLTVMNERKIKLIDELQEALSEIKTLRGIIPICMYCHKIKADMGDWNKLETYIEKHSDADFTHGICPDCLEKEKAKLPKKD